MHGLAVVVFGGAAGAGGLLLFYRALVLGALGLVAPLAATGVLLPVVWGLASGDRPSLPQLLGMGCALAGVAVVVRAPPPQGGSRPAGQRRALAYALAAAVLFGLFYIGLDRGSKGSVLVTVAVTRLAAVVVLSAAVGARRVRVRWPVRTMLLAAATGLVDVSANSLYAYATTRGLLSTVSVVSALYPVVTVALAAVFLRERLRAEQRLGSLLALCGVVLLSVG